MTLHIGEELIFWLSLGTPRRVLSRCCDMMSYMRPDHLGSPRPIRTARHLPEPRPRRGLRAPHGAARRVPRAPVFAARRRVPPRRRLRAPLGVAGEPYYRVRGSPEILLLYYYPKLLHLYYTSTIRLLYYYYTSTPLVLYYYY